MTRIGFIAEMRRTRQGTFTHPASSSGFKISINFTIFDCEVWRRDESSGEVKWQKHDYWPAYGLLRRSSVSKFQWSIALGCGGMWLYVVLKLTFGCQFIGSYNSNAITHVFFSFLFLFQILLLLESGSKHQFVVDENMEETSEFGKR